MRTIYKKVNIKVGSNFLNYKHLRNWLIISFRFERGCFRRCPGATREHSRGSVTKEQRRQRRKDAVQTRKLLSASSLKVARPKKGCGRPASGTSHSGLLGLYVNMGFRSFSRRIIPSFLHSLKRQAPGLISVRPNVRPSSRRGPGSPALGKRALSMYL